MPDKPDSLEEGTWFASLQTTKTGYGVDLSWHVWDKNVDCSAFFVRSREDIDDLLRLLAQVREQLPPDDETDFAKNVLRKGSPK